MNWQHLIYFKTVARLQNYAKAADELYITPSALSRAIHSLEEELHIPLFQKEGRNSRLTPYGEEFYQCVCRCVDEINDCIHSIHTKMDIIRGTLRIAGIYTMCADFLPMQIQTFRAHYPDVNIEMDYNTTNVILQRLLAHEVDLGFCGDYDAEAAQYADLKRVFIKREELIILVSESHPLAKRKTVDFGELQDESFIVHKASSTGTGPMFHALCREYGISPRIAFSVPDDQSIIGLVKQNLGIALIADSPSLKTGGTVALHFRKNKLFRNQYMVWNTTSPTALTTDAFGKHILTQQQM